MRPRYPLKLTSDERLSPAAICRFGGSSGYSGGGVTPPLEASRRGGVSAGGGELCRRARSVRPIAGAVVRRGRPTEDKSGRFRRALPSANAVGRDGRPPDGSVTTPRASGRPSQLLVGLADRPVGSASRTGSTGPPPGFGWSRTEHVESRDATPRTGRENGRPRYNCVSCL